MTFPQERICNSFCMALVFSSIKALIFQREVVFPVKSGEKYRVFYGNPKAPAPQYDLDKYFQYLDVDSAVYAKLSAQKSNPDFVPEAVPEKPLSERIPWLFSASLTLTSLILVFMVYRFMKK